MVPSPLPRKIIEMPAIDSSSTPAQIVVCCGGGGIPVAVDSNGRVRGVAAVIDKDRTTGLLARHLEAPTLVILTAVEYACINYGKPDEQQLKQITADEAEAYLNANQFGAGSMRPKIETGIDFVRHSPHADAVAIIAHVNHFAAALDGKSGTRIVRGLDSISNGSAINVSAAEIAAIRSCKPAGNFDRSGSNGLLIAGDDMPFRMHPPAADHHVAHKLRPHRKQKVAGQILGRHRRRRSIVRQNQIGRRAGFQHAQFHSQALATQTAPIGRAFAAAAQTAAAARHRGF